MSTTSGRLQRLLLGVDGSPEADQALAWTVSVAQLTGASVSVVCAFEVPWSFERPAATIVDGSPGLTEDDARMVTEQAVEVLTVAGIAADATAFEGTFPQAVLALCEAQSPDLVVIGGRSHGGAREFLLGSNAEKVVRSAPVSVLVVR
jgi:nucleotide-binding universal stress UspA family protein